jgi:hypothetical protein
MLNESMSMIWPAGLDWNLIWIISTYLLDVDVMYQLELSCGTCLSAWELEWSMDPHPAQREVRRSKY